MWRQHYTERCVQVIERHELSLQCIQLNIGRNRFVHHCILFLLTLNPAYFHSSHSFIYLTATLLGTPVAPLLIPHSILCKLYIKTSMCENFPRFWNNQTSLSGTNNQTTVQDTELIFSPYSDIWCESAQPVIAMILCTALLQHDWLVCRCTGRGVYITDKIIEMEIKKTVITCICS